ncbi:MAG: hypothetical protein V7746_11580 [Halioglobus sp.]
MDPLYDIYFAGEILPGQELAKVRENLGRLFKADDAILERLFSGSPQRLKGNCNRDTALKYKKAMEQAGAKPIVRPVEDMSAVEPEAPAKNLTAAEKIAQLAAADDVHDNAPATPADPAPNTAATEQFDLAPPGSDVLSPEERQPAVVANINTDGFEVMAAGSKLSETENPAPAAPDTTHLSMGDVGEDIPVLKVEVELLSPDTSAIDLSPAGSDFSDCATPTPPEPDLDLSDLELSPSGADMLDENYRPPEAPEAPATDHIKLEKP